MKKTFLYTTYSLLICLLFITCESDHDGVNPKEVLPEVHQKHARAMDGPYIFYPSGNKMRVLSVDAEKKVWNDIYYDEVPANFSFEVVSHNYKHRFTVPLHKTERQYWKQEAPEKILAVSDPHGDMDCFVSVLKANGVINEKYEWTFGKNHLMILGDIFDRGDDVLPIFWLTYKLQKEATEAGGAVHFLIGNHESMVLRSDLRYINDKYAKLATQFELDYSKFFAANTELGQWIGLGNTIQIIGRTLFVHGGLSQGFYDRNLDIANVNWQMSTGIFMDKAGRDNLTSNSKFLFSSSSSTEGGPGPLWYRGMVGYESHEALSEETLDLLLQRYDVDRVVVGHTVMDDVTTFYGQRVIAINVDNQMNYDRQAGRGIIIEKDGVYVINDKGIANKITE